MKISKSIIMNDKEKQYLDIMEMTKNSILTEGNPNIQFSKETAKLHPKETQPIIDLLKNYKKTKSIEQSLKDMEDTLIRDTIRDKKLAETISNVPPMYASFSPPGSVPIKFSNVTEKSSTLLQYKDPYKELLKEVYFLIIIK